MFTMKISLKSKIMLLAVTLVITVVVSSTYISYLHTAGAIGEQLFSQARSEIIEGNIKACILISIITIMVVFFSVTRLLKPLEKLASSIRNATENGKDQIAGFTRITKKDIDALARNFDLVLENHQNLIGDISGHAESLNTSSSSFKELVGGIAAVAEMMNDISTTVSTAAEKMSGNMNSVAAAMEQSSSNINLVASAAEEMTATINEIPFTIDKRTVKFG